MLQPLYITSSCSIQNAIICKDQNELFADNVTTNAVDFLVNAYRHFDFNYPRFYKMDNLCKLGWLCAEILVKKPGNDPVKDQPNLLQHLEPESVCLLLCNASSSLDTDVKYFKTVAQMASPALFVYTLPNIVIGELCIRNGWQGENMFLITETFDAAFLEQQVNYLLQVESNKACVCGWVDFKDNNYSAMLFIAEKNNAGQNIIFTAENIESIYRNGMDKKAVETK